MKPTITVRAERPGDACAVRDVVRRAFADVSYSDQNCMILALAPRAFDGLVGRVHYAAGWLDH